MTSAFNQAGIVPEWTKQDRIRKARELREMKQSDLAAAIGVSRGTLASIEQGVREPRRGEVIAGWLGKMISRALPPGVTAHKLRHRFASVSYAKTHDLRAIQELLGHASLATTQVYVRVSTTETRAAAQAAWQIAA